MSPKGRLIFLNALISFLLILSGMVVLTGMAGAIPAEVISHRLDPGEPTVGSPLNVTVEFEIYDEPLTYITIQWCIVEEGGGGACGPMKDMAKDGTGRNYSIDYPAGTFQNATYEFHVYDNYNPIYDFETHVARKPSYIRIDATMVPNTIHPNETITVAGQLLTDIGQPVVGAEMNLSIPDSSVFSLGTSGEDGVFSMDLMVPGSGYFIVNLTASQDGLFGYADLPLTVSDWMLPNMAITGTGIDFDEGDAPPGAGDNTFYQNASVIFDFEVSNTGTDQAMNVTIHLDHDNGTISDIIQDSNLLPGQRYPGSIQLNTSELGTHTIKMSVSWDQTAPFPEGHRVPTLDLAYKVLPRPVWTGHTVFVEMFTQITCAPCVYVEESLEVLHEDGVNFEYVVYVVEDSESEMIADTRDVVTTPVLFIDGDLYRKNGSSNDVEVEIDEVRGLIEDAASLERPPVELQFIDGEDLMLTAFLDPEYRDHVSGLMKLYRIEAHSMVRNNQSIPMSNRYMGSGPGQEIDDLGPGEWFNITLDRPLPGESYIAVMESDYGEILISTSLPSGPAPEAYIAKEQVLLRMGSPGEKDIHLVADRFQFEDKGFDDVSLDISISDLPEGWSVLMGDAAISDQGTTIAFTRGSSMKEMKPVGRVRYYQDILLSLSIPDNVSGNFDFNLMVEAGSDRYDVLVIVIVTDQEAPEIEILDVHLEGEGKTIYLYVEAKNIPQGALVKAIVLPCNYEDGGSCGQWQSFILSPLEGGKYRVALAGIDMSGYTHLSYRAWVEVDGAKYAETEDEQKEIASLIDIEGLDGEDNGLSPWLILSLVLGVIVIVAILLAFIIMARRSSIEEPADEHEAGGPMEGGEAEGGALPSDGSEVSEIVQQAPSYEGSENAIAGEHQAVDDLANSEEGPPPSDP
ncbi:MAG: hypothetical protein JXA22_02885 [Candidatus Thermoplasmatota archaeon]|nr:hypothetical protein [Candidatus Thermoplasmatota archaeon]